jgi:hypothetical protein
MALRLSEYEALEREPCPIHYQLNKIIMTQTDTLQIVKSFRVRTDALIQELRNTILATPLPTDKEGDLTLREKAKDESLTKLIEAKMWMGKICEGLNNPFPPEFADKATLPVNS